MSGRALRALLNPSTVLAGVVLALSVSANEILILLDI
jgi:hypothetical protein